MRVRMLVAAGAALLFAVWTASAAPTDEECMACHNDPNLTRTLENGATQSLYIDAEVFSKSIHGGAGCAACHADIEELPHAEKLKPVDCGSCHDQAQEYANGLHGKELAKERAAGEADVTGCKDCHGTHEMRASSDPLSTTNRHNLAQTCGRCHSDASLVKRHMVSISKPSEAYLQGVHAKAIAKGNEKAAVCTDCHGSHTILPSQDQSAPIARQNIHTTCGKCHEKEMQEFERSIHGKALAAGIPDSPTCTDCHGEHDIIPPKDDDSPVGRHLVSKSTCPRCHDDTRIMKRYGVETMRQASYMDSYHGMASAAGSLVVASCTSCHGVHEILPQTDPTSSTNKANLPKTCGKCHEGADEKYASSPVHIMPTDPGQKALGIVRLVYLWLIVVVLGGMVVHNSLMMGRHALGKFFEEISGVRTHKRFSFGQVIGHLILSVSFTVLAISGFALRYPDNYWLHILFFNGGSMETRGFVHRVAGVVLMVLIALHMINGIATRKGRKELISLLPNFKDVRDVFINIKYMIGLTKERPKFGRYGYSEKLEYWGMMWGSVLMGVTGVCMWYAEYFLKHFQKIVLDIVALIHFYEAWLAVGTIIIWHMYYMILDPETYPMNWSWITGKITEKDYKERHPLEFEQEVQEAATGEKKENPKLASTMDESNPKGK